MSGVRPDRFDHEVEFAGAVDLARHAVGEIDWFYQSGASFLYPDAWEPFIAHIPEEERGDLLSAYYRRLRSDNPDVRLAAAKIWSRWEGATSKLLPDATFAARYEEDEFALAFARIEAHYFFQQGLF